MAAAEDRESRVRDLAESFRVYDTCVDVVSAWEMIFTESNTDLRRRVVHFERFPSVRTPDGQEVSPDFTTVFESGPGLVGEVCRFGLNEESVDGLCEQIGRYDSLTHLPVGGGAMAAVPSVDVMLLVPFELGTAAVRRVIVERCELPAHPYKPSRPPVVVQFSLLQGDDRYVFQRRPDAANGDFHDHGEREGSRLSVDWFDRDDVKVRPERFRHIKSARAFVNDPIPPLYLATFLWAKTFAVRATDGARPIIMPVVVSDLAEQLRREHGLVRTADVEAALTFLQRAGLAERTTVGWSVQWNDLHRSGSDRDLADTLARRFLRPPRSTGQKRAQSPDASPVLEHPQQSLF